MRDHELELIAALAEGRLEDETEARALIDSSVEAAAEYEAQRAAILALSSLGSASMTDPERARLRREIWTDLRTGTTGPATAGWLRWAPAAAALLVVAGVLGVMAPRVMQGDQAAYRDVGSALGEADTAADAPAEEATAGDGQEPSAAPTSTAGAAGTTTVADGAEAYALSDEAISFYTEQSALVRDGRATLDSSADDDSAIERCLSRAGLDDARVLGTLRAPDGVVAIVAVPREGEMSDATVTFVDNRLCEVVYVDGRTG